MATLIDTNILLDIVTRDEQWQDWSVRQLEIAALRGPLFVNDMVFAELSCAYKKIESLDSMLADGGIAFIQTPRPALFLAGKAFQRYRAAGGPRIAILPDFFIGAHAAISGMTLLTRDARRYRTYFPSLRLVTPEP